MNARELFEKTQEALAIAGSPEWDAPELIPRRDVLVCLSDDEHEPVWALMPAEGDDPEYEPLDTDLARALIESHLRRWLVDRAWQVQVSVSKTSSKWRLADCLSIGSGGGDRLDDDYPHGESELDVLCASVVVLNRAGF